MKNRNFSDLSNLSMLEIFQVEAENQAAVITAGLLELERNTAALHHLEALMRAAHSLKGAASIVNLEIAVKIAHAMEDCFVAAQNGKILLRRPEIDLLLQGVDLISHISKRSGQEGANWETEHSSQIQNFLSGATRITSPDNAEKDKTTESPLAEMPGESATPLNLQRNDDPGKPGSALSVPRPAETPDRVLRLTAENLNRLLGLAGESLVESRWLRPFAESLLRLKRLQNDMAQTISGLRDSMPAYGMAEDVEPRLAELSQKAAECRQFLSERLVDLELYDRRSGNLSHRLYREVLQCRMRPFGEGVRRFPRMVRDLARELGKEVHLEIIGENTQVDRDILEKMEAALAHLLRNAVDHGCETPEQRRRAGKLPECTIRLEARHSAGMLLISVSDDGTGVDPAVLRETIVQKRLANPAVAEKLTEAELLEFLLLPGFTLRQTVTEISGRGVGLDVVHNMVKSVRGTVRIMTQPGRGMRFQLQLPLTLSVLRTLLVEISGEPYAFPLSHITRAFKLDPAKIESVEGRHYFTFGKQQVGLLTAHQLLDRDAPAPAGGELPVVVLGDRASRYGLLVDRFLGERELVVQGLDPRLGKVRDISSGALMEDGSPVLIFDVEDMIRSIEKLVSAGTLRNVERNVIELGSRLTKRILVVDDSLTVRELQRKLLTSGGYIADVAVDGMDGWNAVRTGNYDLIITDVDMPRMDGIELTVLIRQHANLKTLPVMIVSYKDREEDRMRGLEAGADYYLTKGGFHDAALLQAVVDLIGEANT